MPKSDFKIFDITREIVLNLNESYDNELKDEDLKQLIFTIVKNTKDTKGYESLSDEETKERITSCAEEVISNFNSFKNLISNGKNELINYKLSEVTYDKLSAFIIKNPEISLLKGEICYYSGYAVAVHPKEVTVGYTGGSRGFNVRLFKGVSYRFGASKAQPVKERITQEFPGKFYITNKRLVLKTLKYGFNLKYEKIISIDKHDDGFIVTSDMSKTYPFTTYNVARIKQIIDLVKEDNSKSETRSNSKVNNTKVKVSKADEILKFKKLLDCGAISQEEFENEKKKLLNDL